MQETIAGIAIIVVVLAALLFVVMKMAKQATGGVKSYFSVPNEPKKKPEDNKLKDIEHRLSVASMLLGYTVLKWGFVAVDYATNGVQAEANVYLMFLIFPAGILIWLWGIIDLVLATARICRKDFPKAKLKTSSKVILVVNYILICVSVAELIYCVTA